jgi:hypothetical protein
MRLISSLFLFTVAFVEFSQCEGASEVPLLPEYSESEMQQAIERCGENSSDVSSRIDFFLHKIGTPKAIAFVDAFVRGGMSVDEFLRRARRLSGYLLAEKWEGDSGRRLQQRLLSGETLCSNEVEYFVRLLDEISADVTSSVNADVFDEIFVRRLCETPVPEATKLVHKFLFGGMPADEFKRNAARIFFGYVLDRIPQTDNLNEKIALVDKLHCVRGPIEFPESQGAIEFSQAVLVDVVEQAGDAETICYAMYVLARIRYGANVDELRMRFCQKAARVVHDDDIEQVCSIVSCLDDINTPDAQQLMWALLQRGAANVGGDIKKMCPIASYLNEINTPEAKKLKQNLISNALKDARAMRNVEGLCHVLEALVEADVAEVSDLVTLCRMIWDLSRSWFRVATILRQYKATKVLDALKESGAILGVVRNS